MQELKRPFLLIEDIAGIYKRRRNGVEKEDAEDLIRCYLEYLHKQTKAGEHYAFKIPYLGELYTKLKYIEGDPKKDKVILDALYEADYHSSQVRFASCLVTPPAYEVRTGGMTKDELMYYQNNL